MVALAGALALVAGLSGAARASDFCISYFENAINVASVGGKGFRLPGKGRCKPFFGIGYAQYGLYDVSGSACAATNGSGVSFVLTKSYRTSGLTSVLRVTLPLSLPGVIAGFFFCLIPTLGEYVTPLLVGGGQGSMYGNLIQDQFIRALNWSMGSVMSLAMLVAVLFLLFLFSRVGSVSKLLEL